MPYDYIPRPDTDFGGYSNQFYTAALAWWTAQGLPFGDILPLGLAVGSWNVSYPAHVTAQAAAEGARRKKDEARRALEAQMRPIAGFIQAHTATTDGDRAAIGITVPSGTGFPAGVPRSRPLARVESKQRLTHTLRFADESTPTRKAKPPGVLAAEVWVAVADTAQPPPLLGDAYRFVSVSSRGSLRAGFTAADAGKTAHYALRWVSTRGERGPWSEVCSATVAA